ncbi:MAG TPA: hypothetical protein VK453_29070 [Micromonosporaceae bacterium]|nr:hypothetical protein [Micromonosporaceae bacterium]
MAHAGDGERVAAALVDRLAGLTFVDKTADEVTALLIDAAAAWAAEQGWRVYRRAASVLPLPPPYAHQRSTVDLACARPHGAPIVIEFDRTNRQRSIDKLLAEAAAGRVAIWVRWNSRRIEPAPPPIWLVPCEVIARSGAGDRGRLFSRLPAPDRPAPMHTVLEGAVDQQPDLFS